MSAPRVSVVCSTYGRAELLPALFDSLAAQHMEPDEFELVVVDNGSRDETGAVLERLAASAPFTTRVLALPVNRGAAGGRNAAWRAASAEIVAFTDDDCTPTPEWLERGVAALEAQGPDAFVAGATGPTPSQAHLLERPFSRSLSVAEMRFFETCNIFYRRRDLEEADGLDERLGTGEDTDLALRLIEAGRRPVWEPAALVHHRVRPPSLRAYVRDGRRWVDLPLVVKRHHDRRGELVHRRWFWKRTHPPTVLALVGLVAAVAARSPRPLVLGAWWVWHRVVVEPACPGPRRRVVVLPGVFAVDVVEVATMIEGSVRHRSLLL